ncbi:hypothetical protein VD0004_g3889 [Verticillium dahliae]|nr:hypothetical protein VD0004_g3889 [Verticillium dahliae]PNH75658.1 hypothetical protein VD0001_g1934 [Verticillium dahliae]RBQ82356.1 hypothetical protein VDGD_21063 [Verticillium dahliae]
MPCNPSSRRYFANLARRLCVRCLEPYSQHHICSSHEEHVHRTALHV